MIIIERLNEVKKNVLIIKLIIYVKYEQKNISMPCLIKNGPIRKTYLNNNK